MHREQCLSLVSPVLAQLFLRRLPFSPIERASCGACAWWSFRLSYRRTVTDHFGERMYGAVCLFAHRSFLSQTTLRQATRWLFPSPAPLLPPVRQQVLVPGCRRLSATGCNTSGTNQSCT